MNIWKELANQRPQKPAAEDRDLHEFRSVVAAWADATARLNRKLVANMDAVPLHFPSDDVRALIESGADIDSADANGRTALITAAQFGNAGDVLALIKAGANVLAKDKNGFTALFMAAYKGDVDSISVLISAGAKVDATDNEGSTPLLIAAHAGHIDCAGFLLSAGANPNHKNNVGLSARSLLASALQPPSPNE